MQKKLGLALSVAAAWFLLLPTPAGAQESATVRLHVDTPYVLEVDHRGPGVLAWEQVCTSPCDIPVPALGQYRVRGQGLTSSAPFTLNPVRESAVLQVSPGNKKKERTGWFVIGGAGAAVVAGAVLAAVGTGEGQVAGQGGPGDSGMTSSAKVNFYLAGTALIVAGLVAGVYGGSLVLGNSQSTVRESDEQAPSTPVSPQSGAREVRGVEAALARAPTFVVPILSRVILRPASHTST